jgi:glutamate synthase (ferredoxin)
MMTNMVMFLQLLALLSSVTSLKYGSLRMPVRVTKGTSLNMAVYSSDKGVPAALVEERDACGVGFIASLSNKPSHNIIQQALTACACMEHRGATSADNVSGDGAGVLSAIPWKLFSGLIDLDKVPKNKDNSDALAVGMFFLPTDVALQGDLMNMIKVIFEKYDFKVNGWRDVPVNYDVLGSLSRDFAPAVKQIVVQAQPDYVSDTSKAFDLRLYDARREIQGKFRQLKNTDAYCCSLSTKTVIYKGMLRSCDLSNFFLDLVNPDFETAFAVYHRRFSTNTIPKWYLAQPMRLLAHNGEINTLLGNINWVKSRQYAFRKTVKNLICLIDDKDCDASIQNVLEEKPELISKTVQGPLVDVGRSDSANLDSVLDSYVRSGFSPEEALMILVPEAYESQPKMKDSPDVNAFYSYYESVQEAWDGPALLVFSDGDSVGASLDRNGLRPARYMLTQQQDGGEEETLVHVMSEVGVTKLLDQFAGPAAEHNGVKLIGAGRLGPGEMLSVNLKEGKLYLNDAIKKAVSTKKPYETWVSKIVKPLTRMSFDKDIERYINTYGGEVPSEKTGVVGEADNQKLITKQSYFGWGTEDVDFQISAMAATANEATFSMGDDAPLAALSSMPHTLYDYFKQRFAQVTNPAIDPLREGAVMSLNMFLGRRGNAIQDPDFTDSKDQRVKIESPVMNTAEYEQISSDGSVNAVTISTLYPIADALTQGGLHDQVRKICADAVQKVREGATVINLSDMPAEDGVDSGLTYIPPMMAVGAVHHELISRGLRTNASIIVTTGQAWSTHHFACLVGYGASAVVPYAAYDAVINWHSGKRTQFQMRKGEVPQISAEQAIANYRKAVDKGLLKILSKIGISLLTSYHGAQIFEALGLADDVVMETFKGTPCRMPGLTFDEIAAETADFSRVTFGDSHFEGMVQKVEGLPKEGGGETASKLFNYGFLNFFKSGDYHHNNQPLVKTLHAAIRTGDLDLYNQYEQAIQSRPPTTVRDTLQFSKVGRAPVPLDTVESAESIMKRFVTGGMSLGALSREAHETLAIGMNRIGGKSNSGEGGEDFIRSTPITDVAEDGTSPTFPHLKGLKNGDFPSSRIKQVASGRFGVTPQYLMSADQLEIKIAQGAKPGEGGQLPGKKIDQYIATLRSSKPGVTLISPPPHHDIYSIEDLAQLIYDLHQINPAAGVSVKLVSEVGIGTVASGVAKAGADIIQVAGHDGGTGASPLSSIKSAGSPWELGLVEAHSTLLSNGLRDRVLLRVDGGMKSGWDVVMGAAMGAEEYGFGTIALIAEGCIMARICHTNNCPVGVTTQQEKLRKKFPGQPENIVTFFGYVAEEVRHILAELGYTSLSQVIGRPGVLEPRQGLNIKKTKHLDVSWALESLTCLPKTGENFCAVEDTRSWLEHGPNFDNGRTFDDIILEDADVMAVINGNDNVVQKSMHITNVDRSAFARVSGVIAKKYGDTGFNGKVQYKLTGAAGQSFGAFLGKGMEVSLNGYANDYVGKSMAGGMISVFPPAEDRQASKDCKTAVYGGADSSVTRSQFNMVGNTVLYGATGGELFVNGRGGERFAVRNSGALGVVEGLGDHGAEYMTAGTIVNLGTIGRNFGAGMTGGVAFIVPDEAWLDSDYFADSAPADVVESKVAFDEYINGELVVCKVIDGTYDAARAFLAEVLAKHVAETTSHRAEFLLAHLDEALSLGKIRVVIPSAESTNPLVLSRSSVVAASVQADALVGAK